MNRRKLVCRIALTPILLMMLAACADQPKPKAECTFGKSQVTARLYLDSGSGPTLTYTSRVTFQAPGQAPKTIVESNINPVFINLACDGDTLKISRWISPHETPQYQLPLRWIEDALLEKPMTFSQSRLTSLDYADYVKAWDGTLVASR